MAAMGEDLERLKQEHGLVNLIGLIGRATWKGHLAGLLFLCHDSERM